MSLTDDDERLLGWFLTVAENQQFWLTMNDKLSERYQKGLRSTWDFIVTLVERVARQAGNRSTRQDSLIFSTSGPSKSNMTAPTSCDQCVLVQTFFIHAKIKANEKHNAHSKTIHSDHRKLYSP
jgi:hypothetical protein